MIPPLDNRGLLPEGIHDATLIEIKDRFAISSHRLGLFNNLAWFLSKEINDNTMPVHIAGSYLSDKEKPNDIEIAIPLDLTLLKTSNGQRIFKLMEKHDSFKIDYSIDFYAFCDIDGNPYNFVRFFQYVGTKTALSKGLDEKDKRGIIKVKL